MRVKSDLIRDSGISIINGMKTAVRVFNVRSINSNTPFVLDAALTARGIPQYGDKYPKDEFCIARRITVEPLVQGSAVHATSANVQVTYEGNQSVNVDFGSTLHQIMTDTDRNGQEIRVSWSGAKDAAGKLVPQRGVSPKYVRNDFIVFRHWYIVKNKDLTYPTPIEKLKDKYLGTVNSDDFRGSGKHTWMCTQFDGTTIDYGQSYDIVVKLERRNATIDPKDKSEDGWDEYCWYHMWNGEVPNNASKKPVKGVRDGVEKITTLYYESDFTQIGNDLTNIDNL